MFPPLTVCRYWFLYLYELSRVFHLVLKSTNRLRYSLRISYSSPIIRGTDAIPPSARGESSHVCRLVYTACYVLQKLRVLCESYRRMYIRMYVSFVVQCIFTREARPPPRSCRRAALINSSDRERASREINISTAPGVIVADAIESSCASFPLSLDGSALRERKPEDEDGDDDGDNGGVLESKRDEFLAGRRRRDWKMDESRKNRASSGKRRD